MFRTCLRESTEFTGWSLYNLQGQILKSGKETTLYLNEFPEGFHLLTLNLKQGNQHTEKIILRPN